MHRRGIGIVVAMAGCVCGGVTLAQDVKTPDVPPANDPVAGMIGNWQFSNADQDKVCHFVFRNDPASGGYKLDIDKNCPNVFPSTKNVVAWAIDNFGSLRLLDSTGKAVIELNEVETGMFDGFRKEEGRYILQNAASITPTHTAADIAGDAPIVDHIIDELHQALGFRIAALVADPKVADERHAPTLAQATEPLRRHPGPDDAILNRNIRAVVHIHRIPPAPLNRDMVQNHIPRPVHVHRAFLILARRQTLSDPHILDNDIM